MRVVFMGTPEFGVPVLKALVVAGHEVVAVVTQPDRPVGRSGRPVPPPVKQAALEMGIATLQPERLRQPDVIEELRRLAPEVIVVAAFGQILPKAVLAIPRYGCLNCHASLLPKYRGASPIAAAIFAGERETGVTIMRVEAGLDTGAILAQRSEPIRPDDTTESLSRRLAEIGGQLMVETLPRWVTGQAAPQPQDESKASYAPVLRRGQGQIDWTEPAEQIDRQCRAYFPWPGCYGHWDGRLIKLLAVRPLPQWQGEGQPGEVRKGAGAKEMIVVTGKGALAIEKLQLEGKRPTSAADFLRGQGAIIGSILH